MIHNFNPTQTNPYCYSKVFHALYFSPNQAQKNQNEKIESLHNNSNPSTHSKTIMASLPTKLAGDPEFREWATKREIDKREAEFSVYDREWAAKTPEEKQFIKQSCDEELREWEKKQEKLSEEEREQARRRLDDFVKEWEVEEHEKMIREWEVEMKRREEIGKVVAGEQEVALGAGARRGPESIETKDFFVGEGDARLRTRSAENTTTRELKKAVIILDNNEGKSEEEKKGSGEVIVNDDDEDLIAAGSHNRGEKEQKAMRELIVKDDDEDIMVTEASNGRIDEKNDFKKRYDA